MSTVTPFILKASCASLFLQLAWLAFQVRWAHIPCWLSSFLLGYPSTGSSDPGSRKRGGRRSHFDSVQSPAEPCPHNHNCLVTVRDPIMLFFSQALVPSPHPLLQGSQGQCLYLGDISLSPQRVPNASCSAIMLSCLTATKEIEYPPQAPGPRRYSGASKQSQGGPSPAQQTWNSRSVELASSRLLLASPAASDIL